MVITSAHLEDYLWQRLMVISVEDIGFGESNAPILVNALHQMLMTFERHLGERKLFAIHAVRYLCQCKKDRSSDEMVVWVKLATEHEELRPRIPDYALDMHTREGIAMGRGLRHFFETGAQLSPEMSGRDLTYRQRIMDILDDLESKEG